MRKTRIEGINGFLELNNNYIYLVLNNNSIEEEHVIWFYEIEDIVYKKPTRNKNGFISLYVSIYGFVSKRKKAYTLLLKKIDEKTVDKNNDIYIAIKSIINVKNANVLEVVEPVEEPKKEEPEDELQEIKRIIKENNEREKNKYAGTVIRPQEESEKQSPIVTIVEEKETLEIPKEIKEEQIPSPIISPIPTTMPVEEKKDFVVVEKQEKPIIKPDIKIEQKEEKKPSAVEYKEEKIEKPKENEIGSVEPIKQEEKPITVQKPKQIQTTIPLVEPVKEPDYSYIVVEPEKIEEVLTIIDEKEDEEEQEEFKEEKKVTSIEKLDDKAHDIERELQTLTYKEIILSEFLDNDLDRKKIDKLIIELKKIIEKINKIKQEILKQEKTINFDNSIKLDNGNIIVSNLGETSFDEKSLNDYIDRYKDIIKKLDRIQSETDELSISSEKRKQSIGLSDDEYEKRINQFKDVKDNKEFIKRLISETKEDLSKVKRRIEKTIEPRIKYKFVRRSIAKQTERLAALTALNGLRPKHSRLSMIALSLFTGVSAITDLLGYEIKEVEYNEVIQKEFLEGLEFVDTDKARMLINSSKDQIDSIIYECEKKYSDYPNFKSLKNNLISLRRDIDSQDKELIALEDKIKEYNLEPKVKILKH